MAGARILVLDIETAPMTVYTWGLFKQDISINQVITPGRVIGVGYKWHGEKQARFVGEHNATHDKMILTTWGLLHEADIVVHFNGKTFDMPHLNTEFHKLRLGPPAPYAQVDLLNEVKSHFRLDSNKLDYVSRSFNVGEKVKHEGFALWTACLAGDPKAWRRMEKYCKQDVNLTDTLFTELTPWLDSLPVLGLFSEDADLDACPNCEQPTLVKEGWAYTKLAKFQRYHCASCGKWCRAGRAEKRVDIRGVAA